ncbi:MAG TPA: hypothetical protein VFF67_09535 [Thermoplasmata archaeon]|nr:hypothetical protein [Thermoplasmata archaeon]
MASNGVEPPARAEPAEAGFGRVASTSPVAVVWCRQVDNEAESPGYTTVPEEFPGHRETLDAIRIVGNLTVNIADTHDYWDPDPSAPLSYYPNLFLYPAYGGHYTCIGRMFLSTEDRPRLGMKTLVLDTQQLLATGEFGPTVLRWHASMGGGRRDGGRPPPIPDANLYPALGEGFLFHKGSTDPIVVVAAGEWEAAMQTVLELVRSLPASLVTLGAILAFPYFLPQPKTNLHEFTEQIPLALALMRVGKGEAGTERHAKRIMSWEGSSVQVRDITDGVPPPTGRGKDTVPLVLQYIRDHNEKKLEPIVQRVDAVELPRLATHLTDPERQGGRDRRKEIWRIATAMESAALLLQKSRGRHVPVSKEAAKRAQEYLQARVTAPEPVDDPPEEAVVAVPDALGAVAATGKPPSPIPSWLQRATDNPLPGTRPEKAEAVPVSISDDPSLLKAPPPAALPTEAAGAPGNGAAARAATPLTSPPPRSAAPAPTPAATPSPSSLAPSSSPHTAPAAPASDGGGAKVAASPASRPTPAPAPVPAPVPPMHLAVDLAPLRRDIELNLTRYLDERLAIAAEAAAKTASDAATAAIEPHLLERADQQAAQLRDDIERQSITTRTEILSDVRRQLHELENRFMAALPTAIQGEVDRKLAPALETRVNAASARALEALRVESARATEAMKAETLGALDESRQAFAKSEDELRAGLSAQFDLHQRDAAQREETSRAELEERLTSGINQRLGDADQKRAREAKELEQRLGLLVDGRHRETLDRLTGGLAQADARLGRSVDDRLRELDARVAATSDQRANEIQAANVAGIADLQVRLQSYADQKLREGLDREREKYLELLARLRAEVDGALVRATESTRVDAQLREKIARSVDTLPSETQKTIASAVEAVESRVRAEQTDQVRRLDTFESELKDREQEIILLEQAFRTDVEDVERRTTILSERLVPIVRKTWLRISELEKRNPDNPDVEYRLTQVRRDVARDVRRLETMIGEQVQELRDRMETSIANQGRVWLTLLQQLSTLSEGRRAQQAAPAPRPAPPREPSDASIDAWLDSAERDRRDPPGVHPAIDDDAEVDDLADVTPAAQRRRPRRAASR